MLASLRVLEDYQATFCEPYTSESGPREAAARITLRAGQEGIHEGDEALGWDTPVALRSLHGVSDEVRREVVAFIAEDRAHHRPGPGMADILGIGP